jgi:hypothetical protein
MIHWLNGGKHDGPGADIINTAPAEKFLVYQRTELFSLQRLGHFENWKAFSHGHFKFSPFFPL